MNNAQTPDGLDIEALRAELAVRHQALLAPNDPIFLTVALNDMVLRNHLKLVESLNRDARLQTDAALAREIEAVKSAAAMLVTQTAQYIANQVRASIDEEVLRVTATAADCEMRSRVAVWGAAVAVMSTVLTIGLLILFHH